MRAIGHGLTKTLGQSVIVENRPGAGTQIGAQACAAAPADGYTFCMLPVDALSYQPLLTKNLPYDPDRSFDPITAVFYLTEVMVVSPATNVTTVDGLVALSKAKPNTLNYATTATSSILFFENFKHETGADITKVVYKGGADAVNAMLSGEAQAGFFGLGNVVGQIQSGSLKALAVDGTQRSPLLPQVPTLAQAGYQGAQNRVWFGLFAPAGTPTPIIVRLQREVERVVREPEFPAKVYEWARTRAHSQLADGIRQLSPRRSCPRGTPRQAFRTSNAVTTRKDAVTPSCNGKTHETFSGCCRMCARLGGTV